MEESINRQKVAIAELYNRVASQYGQIGPAMLAHFGQRLVQRVGVTEGSALLDVAAGRGASLLPASETIGDKGQVVGIDLAAAMVSETNSELLQTGRGRIKMLQMDGESVAFREASFDYLICGFAIFFFLHPEQTLVEWHRVLRPGGKVGICIAGQGDERWQWYEDLLYSYHQIYGFPLSPISSNSDRLYKQASIETALINAYFVNIQTVIDEYEFIYTDAQQWWAAKWTHGAGYPLMHMASEVLNEFKAEVFAQLERLREPDGFHEKWQLVSIIGTKPKCGNSYPPASG